ncbi:hypothetical protein HZF05_02805 [Sphingomonas sp. CGMCC 1.13654]|uniref:LysR substrate-binding domain-containing protein n=1 Tax=Sphingomonas chungangi TaxID=2683589 RepID=A0A838L3Q0_9SPHN|nr:LysR substrate-binding domain-containing protein [Sphingomonas chungangi]MBA2933019.1 hypothetical protein [Sphingomonas chungangi]MVW56639.1 hypothetical protein [Sphingomonas chungangi]
MSARTFFIDRPVNMIDEGIDVAVRIGHQPDSGLTAIKIGSVRRVMCGAPFHFAKHDVPTTPAELKDHRIAGSTGAWASSDWRFGQDQRVTIHPALQANTNEAVIEAAIAGRGLTRVLHYQIGLALPSGAPQIALGDYEEEALPIPMLHPEGSRAPANVRAFDLAVARLRGNRLLN